MRAIAALLSLLVTLASATAWADDRPACAEPPDDAEVRRRLARVSAFITEQEPQSRRWFTTFAVVHAAMAAGAGMIAIAADQNEGQRIDMTFNAISSTLALGTRLIGTPPIMGAGDSLRDRPRSTPAERLRLLREAEDVLRREANAVDFAHGVLGATGNALYVTGAATALLVGFDRVGAAYTLGIGGSLIGLGRLILRPTGARARWRGYRRDHPDAACDDAVVARSPEPRARVSVAGAGLSLTLTF